MASSGTARAGIPTRHDLLEALVEDGTLIPGIVEGVRGDRFILAGEQSMLAGSIESKTGALQASRSSPRWIRSPGTVTC